VTAIRTGRWTAARDDPYVVFIIGMRFNKPWKVHRWLPVFLAMPRMIGELEKKPELGFLGAQTWFSRTTLMVQYWRSFDALETYAKSRDASHLPAWAAFNRAVGANGDVGIYHETYRIEPGAYENIYANMPPTLFGKVGSLVDANAPNNSARERMSQRGR